MLSFAAASWMVKKLDQLALVDPIGEPGDCRGRYGPILPKEKLLSDRA